MHGDLLHADICDCLHEKIVVPRKMAEWCDWPTNHDDLRARRKWLADWVAGPGPDRIRDDADWCDVKAAGWWVWCMCHNIRAASSGGWDIDSVPSASAIGVAANRNSPDPGGLPTGERWFGWFDELARRLKQVAVICRPWKSALTPSMLCLHESRMKTVALVIDPPYVTSCRSKVYECDQDGGKIDEAAAESYRWSIEHGSKYRIAYCMLEGSFPVPRGWTAKTRKFGMQDDGGGGRDCVIFSPSCLVV